MKKKYMYKDGLEALFSLFTIIGYNLILEVGDE